MKAAPTLGALVIFASCWTLRTASRAEENATLERINQAQEILDSLAPEIIVECAIFRAELTRGTALKTWTKEEQEVALERMRTAFHLPEDDDTKAPNFVPQRYSMSEARYLLQAGPPSVPTAPLLAWLGYRVDVLRHLREEARRILRSAALDYAEKAWLSARTPADLETANRVVSQAWISIDGGDFPFTRRTPPTTTQPPNPPGVSEQDRADIYDFLSVLKSEEPFFLPDPSENPAGFAAGQALWLELANIRHAFTLRPAMVVRHAHHHAIFVGLLLAAGQRLNELIEHDATAAQFEPSYLEWRALAVPPPSRQARPFGSPLAIEDYRNLAALSRSGGPAGPHRSPPPAAAAYAAWFELRKAEEAAAPDRIAKARDTLEKERSTLSTSTSAYLASRLSARTTAPALIPQDNVQPVEALIAQLRALLMPEKDRPRPDGAAVLARWKALHSGTGAATEEDRNGLQNFWPDLATRPGSRALFALRDRAARQLLARLYPTDAALATSAVPLSTELRERLTAAITTGSAERTGKLLALDAAGNFLPPVEHLAWAREATVLSNAAALLTSGDRNAARTAYLQVIRHLTEPALGEFAARQALRLGSTPPAKVP